jgi:dTMP kinase
LNPEYSELVPRAEAFLYAAARAQHVAQVILPSLAGGTVVLCDRFVDSSLAYQGFGRGIDIGLLEKINEPATYGLAPDLTIILDFCAEDGMERISNSGRSIDRIEREAGIFTRRSRRGTWPWPGATPPVTGLLTPTGRQVRCTWMSLKRQRLF